MMPPGGLGKMGRGGGDKGKALPKPMIFLTALTCMICTMSIIIAIIVNITMGNRIDNIFKEAGEEYDLPSNSPSGVVTPSQPEGEGQLPFVPEVEVGGGRGGGLADNLPGVGQGGGRTPELPAVLLRNLRRAMKHPTTSSSKDHRHQ